jgi:uncharacterized protein (DUF58 family)
MSEPTAPLAGRWNRRPTARGVGTAVLGGSLLAAGGQWRYAGVLGFGAALLAMALLGFLTVLGRAPVSVRRSVWPLEVTRFEPCRATLRVRRSRGLLPGGIEAVEHVAGEPVLVRLPRLARGGTADIGYAVPTARRGVLAVGPLDLRRRALAGLAESRAGLGGTVQVRVLPRILPVHGMPGGVRRGHAGTDERVPYGGTDLVGLREYLPGDDLRRLHWATSARTGTLMVRQDADPSLAHLTVLLDDRAASYPGDPVDPGADPAGLEDAIEVAASLVLAAADSDHSVRLLTVCGQLDLTHLAVPGVPGGLSARGLVCGLADVVAHPSTQEPAPLPLSALDIVVVVTGAAAGLGPLAGEASRAAVGMLAVVDPDPQGPPVAAAGPVTILRGRTGEELLGGWESAVAP